jgi:xanthine dioxygenase
MAVKTLEVRPLDGPHPQFGAEIAHVDIENLSDADFQTIRNALYNYHIVVLKNQSGLSPKGKPIRKLIGTMLILLASSI